MRVKVKHPVLLILAITFMLIVHVLIWEWPETGSKFDEILFKNDICRMMFFIEIIPLILSLDFEELDKGYKALTIATAIVLFIGNLIFSLGLVMPKSEPIWPDAYEPPMEFVETPDFELPPYDSGIPIVEPMHIVTSEGSGASMEFADRTLRL